MRKNRNQRHKHSLQNPTEPDVDMPIVSTVSEFSHQEQHNNTLFSTDDDGRVPEGEQIQQTYSKTMRGKAFESCSRSLPLKSPQRKSTPEMGTTIPVYIPQFLKFLIDIIIGALGFLKPLFSILLAIILFVSVVKYGFYLVSDTIVNTTCSVPIIHSYLQICQTPAVPDFSNYVKAQEMLYERMVLQAKEQDSISAMDLKRVELATRDLQVMIKYSNLLSADLFQEKLGDYLIHSRQFGKDIQSLQAQSKGVIDNLITYNSFTLRKLANAKAQRLSRQDLRVVYESAMSLVEKEARRLILAIERAQMSMAELEQDLYAVHEISAQEKSYQETDKPNVLADLGNLVQGKGLRRPLVEENLKLLTDFDIQRIRASHHLMLMLDAMEAFQMDLEELRTHVVSPIIAPDALSLEIHIENIDKAIQRLKDGKVIMWKDQHEKNKNKVKKGETITEGT
ncbi:hypothetical protein BDA99DRAFT_514909 [Phascolomyces articulosus]|uniref:Uncharacterized protein n=1 Tax=Phascolomyces articulosus TaxID=60185 RepID=A0AAD5PBY3_9FUNG|nr:hypothetical protein BDA99DRAFT_514909 [Phascolomyces articulosus]